jgi:ATP-dependent DNA ligase
MISKPKIESVPLAQGLRWRGGGGWLYQTKADGVWQVGGLAWGAHRLNAERMPDGRHVVNDLIALDGQDVRHRPLARRWPVLVELARAFPPQIELCATGSGGEFLEAVLASGGEGVVAKSMDAPFAVGWFKCKRLATFDAIVSELHPERQSIRLEFEGADAGWCPCQGANLMQLRPRDVVEIAAQGRHASGKFREARFIRLRPDLAAIAGA